MTTDLDLDDDLDVRPPEPLASAEQRRIIILAIFVVFCFVILSMLYQLQVRYTQAQCYSRMAVLQRYNQTWIDLERAEQDAPGPMTPDRAERIHIYHNATVPGITCR